jgi:hypothetical protein
MSKFAKGKSWIEHRLADDLLLDDARFTVNLLARKGTGVHGFRVTVLFIPHEASGSVEVDLPNVATTADVHRLSRQLADDPGELGRLFAETAAR